MFDFRDERVNAYLSSISSDADNICKKQQQHYSAPSTLQSTVETTTIPTATVVHKSNSTEALVKSLPTLPKLTLKFRKPKTEHIKLYSSTPSTSTNVSSGCTTVSSDSGYSYSDGLEAVEPIMTRSRKRKLQQTVNVATNSNNKKSRRTHKRMSTITIE